VGSGESSWRVVQNSYGGKTGLRVAGTYEINPPPQIASLKVIQLRISKVYAVLGELLLPTALSEDRIVFPAKSEDLLHASL